MAEDEDGVSDKKSPQNSNNAETSQDNQQNPIKPDLGIEEAKYDVKENGDTSPSEPISSSSKSTGAMRKDENPFSFRHFLKRDLSLPGNSTYENKGARPKVYANTVQHSPTKIDLHTDINREKNRPSEIQAKEKQIDGVNHRNSDDTSSSSSVEIEIPFSVVDNSDSKHNLYADGSDGPFFHRPNIASEPLVMPSLPDFVQDHILVEQAYLNSNGPISVDLDNLPDFTFNTNFNTGSSSSLERQNKSGYGSNRGYDYKAFMGVESTTAETGPSNRNIPLDLPTGTEADFTFNKNFNSGSSSSLGRRNKSVYGGNRGYDYKGFMGVESTSAETGPSNRNIPLDLPSGTEADFTFNKNFNTGSSSSLGRRNKSGYGGNRGYDYTAFLGEASTSNETAPSNRNIPLDLPSGTEAAGPMPLDLPPHLSLDLTESVNPADRRNVSPRHSFPLDLPPNAGAESMRLPDFLPVHPGRTSPEPEHQDEQLSQIIAELERTRAELFTERSRRSRAEEDARSSRAAAGALRAELAAARARLSDVTHSDRHAPRPEPETHGQNSLMDTAARATDTESTVTKLKNEIKILKEELSLSQSQVRALSHAQARAAADLRHATARADTSLRELLSGLERLRSLSSTLDPT